MYKKYIKDNEDNEDNEYTNTQEREAQLKEYHNSINRNEKKNPIIGKKSYHIKASKLHLSKLSKLNNDKDDATILNLDSYLKKNNKYSTNFNQKAYDNFKKFDEKVVELITEQIDNDKSPIIQKHIYNAKYSKEIEDLYNKYKETYIDTIIKTPSHKTTKNGEPYPFFMTDLYGKNDLLYENFEKQYGIEKKLEEQTDEEFLNTLEKRINGFKKCITMKDTYRPVSNEYFMNEYVKEKNSYDKIIKKYDKKFFDKELFDKELFDKKLYEKEISKDIDTHCKLIDYSPSMARDKNKITNEKELDKIMDKLIAFYKQNSQEKHYAKTFLPKECWEEKEINYDKIKNIIKSTSVNGRNFVQYVYGFFSNEELKKIKDLELPLYMISGILPILDYDVSCSPLVIWSVLLNMIKTKCSTYNTSPLCFLRLYLPVLDTPINRIDFDDRLSDIPINKDRNKIQ